MAKEKEPLTDKQILDHITQEVYQRWAQVEATRKSDLVERRWKQFWSMVAGFLSGFATVLIVAGLLYKAIERTAVDKVEKKIEVETRDYQQFKDAAVKLLGGVSEEVASANKELGKSQLILEETQLVLVEARGRIEGMYRALDSTPSDADITRLKVMLEQIKQDPELQKIGDVLDGLKRQARMLEGKEKIPTLLVGDLQLVDNEKNIHGRLYRNDGRWEFYIQADDGTILSMFVQNGRAKPVIQYRTRPGQDVPWTPGP